MEIEDLLKYPHELPSYDLNYQKVPCTIFDTTEEGAKRFNELIEFVESLNLDPLVRTRSGGISTNIKYFGPSYDLRPLRSLIELTLLLSKGAWRFQFRTSFERMGNDAMGGHKAFYLFNDICRKYGLDLLDYKLENGARIKQEIQAPVRKVLSSGYLDYDIEGVHHIDFNSSYISNLVEKFPEFRPVGEELYHGRKENPQYKGVINSTIGYFHTEKHNYAWAHLAKAAINGNNEKVWALVRDLRYSGRTPLLINTDGIWYYGDLYHDANEGTELGQWRHDHTNCTLLIRSPNAYQYKENGKIKTVLSGKTRLDKSKPRELWEWGDIYHTDACPIEFVLENNRIVVRNN